MRLLARVVDWTVVGFATWTIAYHLVLFSRLPSYWCLPLWLALGGLAFWFFKGNKKRPLLAGWNFKEFWPELVVGLGLAGWRAIVFVYSLDVYSFLHRALWQAQHLNQPVALHFTSLYATGLPPLSEAHVLSSVEMFGAFFAQLLNLDPMFVNLTLLPSMTAFVAVVAVGLGARLLRLRGLAVFAVLLGFSVALLLSADVYRSFAMFGLGRLSEGKGALLVIGIPVVYVNTIRLLRRPSKRSFVILALTAVCFVGWSSTGILAYPFLALALGLASLATHRNFKTFLLVVGSSVYPVVSFAASRVGVIPRVKDGSVWLVGWPSEWFANISLIARSPFHLGIQLALFSVGVLLACRKKDRWLALAPLVIIVLAFNPVSGPIALKIVPAGVFWRLGYCSAFPLGLGLCAAGVLAAPLWQKTVAGCVSLLVVATGFPLALPGVKYVYATGLTDDHWMPQEVAALNGRGLIRDKRLLAPENLAGLLALEDPNLEFDSVRTIETRHLWRNSLKPIAEANARADAEDFISGTIPSPAGLIDRVQSGLSQIIVKSAMADKVTRVLNQAHFAVESQAIGGSYVFIRVVGRGQ